MSQFDRNKSLQQLDGQDWGEPNFDSHLVVECHRLRRVPLRDFTTEDLRIMIGQNIGLDYLIPLAIERLEANPFTEGACYPCDLLVNVLAGDANFWRRHPEWSKRMVLVTERSISQFPNRPDIASKAVTRAVLEAFEPFQRREKTA